MPYRIANRLLNRRFYPDGSYLISPGGYILRGSEQLIRPLAAEKAEDLFLLCREEGRNFLYVSAPGKPERDEEFTQYGIPCFRNESADLFLAALREKDVPCLDLRPAIWSAGREQGDPYSMFYKTDHHWTADAGLMAAGLVAEELNRLYGLGLDTEAIGEAKMEREVLPEPFIGEMGRKLLGPFGSRDRLVVWRPRSPVHLRYCSPDQNIDTTGDFDILFHESRLGGASNPYYYYMGGNDQLGFIENADGNGSGILLIKDSYSCVVTPYLALTAGKVVWWDMRMDKSVKQYIKEHPELETVVVLYTMSNAVSSEYNDYQ